jgi:hypothetical protein
MRSIVRDTPSFDFISAQSLALPQRDSGAHVAWRLTTGCYKVLKGDRRAWARRAVRRWAGYGRIDVA